MNLDEFFKLNESDWVMVYTESEESSEPKLMNGSDYEGKETQLIVTHFFASEYNEICVYVKGSDKQ